MVGPDAKRSAFEYLNDRYQSSKRMKCRVLGLSRSTARRILVLRDDTQIEQMILDLLKNKEHRGIDWVYQKIRNMGIKWNRKRVLRVYRKLRLTLKRKKRKRIPPRETVPLLQPDNSNITWSMDFMSDALQGGRKIRILTLIDDYNRECLCVRVGISMPSEYVCRILGEVMEIKGKPNKIRTDNGPEFTSAYYKQWMKRINVEPVYIQPGKPAQNGYIERFNRTYREDVLDRYLFDEIGQAQILSEEWQEDYNYGHPHQSLGGMTPIGYKISRRKEMDSSESVKAKINDELAHKLSNSSALTDSTESNLLNAKLNFKPII